MSSRTVTSTTTSQTFARTVSRHLRTQGITVLASGTPRSREGVRVQRGWLNLRAEAVVSVDLDSDCDAAHLAYVVAEVLASGGYAVRRNRHDSTILYVTKAGE